MAQTLPWHAEVSNSSLKVPDDAEIVMLILDGPSKLRNILGLLRNHKRGNPFGRPYSSFHIFGRQTIFLSHPLETSTGTQARSDDFHTWEHIQENRCSHAPGSNSMWRFPKRVVPPNHHLNGIFPYKRSILGYSHDYGNPHFYPTKWLSFR